ncbi:hypothetical protein DYB25_007246 [Aphanomyces astaci]|uniref:Uncharacterized protein n=1 Tax=Aphanomyces astaci TaxID=112090 RepID=A0A397DKS1_APHAT|nr:hypothetical protein DYB25_007246 [Aphanomyces astaci]RHY42255.1 hypothetical protein DYB30_002152 [Aphanomyces astaci]RHY67007.1 hypothetical protein DYB38_005157 [Aphanomyces astaci]
MSSPYVLVSCWEIATFRKIHRIIRCNHYIGITGSMGTRHQPRASVTDDLVAWHGMSVKNFTVMVANGIPLSVQRRQVWMDIISTEMKYRSKSKLSLVHKTFVAYMGTMWEQGSGVLSALTDKLDNSYKSTRTSPKSGKSGKSVRSQHGQSKNIDDQYVRDIVFQLNESNFMVVDSDTTPFVRVDAIIQVVGPEVRNRADVLKILGFLLHHNDTHRLHFDDYGWVGFDVDHTLVEFKLDALLKLSFEKAYKHIQANYMNLRTAQLPVWLPHLAFRGIAVDVIKGNLLHITSTNEVIRGFHGTYELPQNVLGLHYPVQQQRAGTTTYNYLYTNAEIIFGPLYAWLVDQYEAGTITEVEIGYVPLPSGDIDHQMRHLHPEVMKCAVGTDWRSFFDLVLTKAAKEVFFESYHGCRFREVLTTAQNARSIAAATTLERGKVYEGGNLIELMQALVQPSWKCKNTKVLYMGDHPIHDILNPSQSAAAWDTVAVIHESSLLFKHLERHHLRTKQVQTAIQMLFDSVCPCLSARSRGPQIDTKPMPSTSCFYFDCGGPYTSMGKLINRHAVLCVDSVSKLVHAENTINTLLQARLERYFVVT